MEASNLKIAILGGGPGGLCTAIALHRKGFKNITVYERDQNADARKQGYSFSLFAPQGGLAFLKELNLLEEVEPHAFHSRGFRILDGPTGSTLMEFSEKTFKDKPDADSRRIMRAGLRNILVNVCNREGIPVIWNAKYASYEEKENSVILNFDNHLQQEADLVIAADGLHSKVRDQMFGDPEIYTGFTAIFARMYPKDDAQLLEHPFIKESGGIYGGPNTSLFFYHHKTQFADELHWAVTKAMPEGELRKQCGEDQEKLRQYALDLIKDWPGLPTAMVSHTPASGITSIIEFKDKDPLKVDPKTGRVCVSKSKRITILGDAAHPMLPFQAAGGNNALLDAWKLTDQLVTLLSLKQVTGNDIDRVLAVYEKEMAPRGAAAVAGSRKAGKDFHNPSTVSRAIAGTIMKTISWKINTYDTNRAVRWIVKSVFVGLVAAGAAWINSYWNFARFVNLDFLKRK